MITLDGTNGITTPDVDTDGLTVDTNTLFVDATNNRVGVGTSSPGQKLSVNGNVIILAGNELKFAGPSNTNVSAIKAPTDDGSLAFITDNTSESARIDASGSLLVGTTSLPTGSTGGAGFISESADRRTLYCATTTTGTAGVINFANPNGIVGFIATSGSSTIYSTSSDYRLKEDVQPMVGSVDRLMALKPVNFAWKVDGSRVDGFLAHEAQEVVPECVTGEKDAVDDEGNPQYQGIDQSKIVPLLVAALQEALTKIEALEARVAALETNA
jgi:hypothetical protein